MGGFRFAKLPDPCGSFYVARPFASNAAAHSNNAGPAISASPTVIRRQAMLGSAIAITAAWR
ncbi:hypothetical protein C0V72_10760 [Porphyrobacter sp. TH134]|nr:hypothetical protein C0V72_10760 [Porphyrobacter sp. TH134]